LRLVSEPTKSCRHSLRSFISYWWWPARLDLEVIQTASSKPAKVVFKGTPPQNVVVGFGCNNIRLEGSVMLHVQYEYEMDAARS
jgi:hypothetical protein